MTVRLSSRMPRRVVALALAVLALPAFAAPWTPYRAEYEVLRNGKPMGRGGVTLIDHGGDRWELRSVTRGTEGLAGLAGAEILERSTLRVDGDAFETVEYQLRQEMAWKRRERSVSVDVAAGRITSRDRRGEHAFTYQAGVLDRQSIVLALARDLAAGKRGDLTYLMVDRDEFGPERYRVGATETVRVPAGSLEAVRVERLRAGAEARTTVSWLGPAQGYVPVRVLQTEPDGDSFEMRLISLQR
jgi:hypothetical protein